MLPSLFTQQATDYLVISKIITDCDMAPGTQVLNGLRVNLQQILVAARQIKTAFSKSPQIKFKMTNDPTWYQR